jgi:ABC-type transport system involved in multi-copper enzyme maturation permease subunit
MFPGPVFVHELRAVARRRRSYALRLVFGLFLLYVVVAYARPYRYYIYAGPAPYEGEFSFRELALIGASLFTSVAWLQALSVLILTPALVAGAIGEDREREILSYLLASPLSAGEIVLGKLAARLINLAMLVTVGLPVVSIALFLGGVEPAGVWYCFGWTMSALYFVAAISIFVSTFSKRPRDAIVLAYLYEVFWLFLPAIERGLAQSNALLGNWISEARPVTGFLTGCSPMIVLFDSWSGTPRLLDDVCWMIGLQVLYGTVLMAWSTLRLRAVEQGSRLFGLRWMGSSMNVEARPLRARRPCGDDPMLWKECPEALATGGRWKAAYRVLMALAFLAGVAYWFYESAIPAIWEMVSYGYGSTTPSTQRELLNTGVRGFMMCLYPLMALLLAVSAATGFTSEKEKDTWVSLLATPLESAEIIRGKILGAIWRVRYLLAAVLLVLLIGLCCGAVHPLGLLLCLFATGVYSFSFAALGTYISLRAKSSARAIATTLGIGMFCNVGYLFCCFPVITGPPSIIVAAGVSPLIVVGATFSFSEFDEFLKGRYRPYPSEIVVLGLFSLGFYGGVGLKLLHDCFVTFQLEADRPYKGWWPRPEVSAQGIQFLEEEIPEGKEIVYIEEEPGSREDDAEAWDDDT